ncbi:hypothetical protein [Arthrobacter psychrolactophilus]|uniref:hypothetical protein n=1 Tax=Arthrobacter psychrolactophilus TaxID=92442 RepID=UPI0011B5E85A|nr:hypothetical protein [Arthrobacter psychrolactophilus]
MNTLVFSIGLNGYDIGYRMCLDSQREYADRIGADFRVVTKPTVSDPAFAAWLKVTLLDAALKAGYDAVAYIDADCRVSKSAPDFTTELAKSDGKICMSLGRSGRLNSGVIFAENSVTANQFLERVVASVVENIPAKARANLRFENGNIIYVESINGGVHIIDSRWNNSSDDTLDDHIRHFTGPLKSKMHAPLKDRLNFRIRKLFLPRASAAPERREASFLDELQQLTESIVSELDLNPRVDR